MKVEFRTKTLFNRVPVEESIKKYYETIIMFFADQVTQKVDTSKLAAIIVPEDFRAEVIAFQKSIGERPSVTKNEHAEAFGKMLYDRSRDAYYVFLDSCIAQYIMGDDLISSFAKGEDVDTFWNRRRVALTMLAHEMAHASIYGRIWIKNEAKRRTFLGYLSVILFDEYCACRISNSLVSGSLNVSNQDQICELEKLIERERDRFGNRQINAKQFADTLFQHTELILKYMVSYVGAQHGREKQDIDYTEGYIARVASMLARRLQRLFDNLEEERPLDFRSVSDMIVLYFDVMGIKLIEYESGFEIGIKDKK